MQFRLPRRIAPAKIVYGLRPTLFKVVYKPNIQRDFGVEIGRLEPSKYLALEGNREIHRVKLLWPERLSKGIVPSILMNAHADARQHQRPSSWINNTEGNSQDGFRGAGEIMVGLDLPFVSCRHPLHQLGFLQLYRPERGFSGDSGSLGRVSRFQRLPADEEACNDADKDEHPVGLFKGCVPLWRVGVGFGLILCAVVLLFWRGKDDGCLALISGG